jgi:hypothetical protein
VYLGITPVNHFSVKPDNALSIGHGLHKFLLQSSLVNLQTFCRKGRKKTRKGKVFLCAPGVLCG